MTNFKDTIEDVITFSGHPNILATHGNTIEVTKDIEISRRADCIIGVNAAKGCEDLNHQLKNHIRASGLLLMALSVGKHDFHFTGRGCSELELTNSQELVLRKSDFVSSRTAAIRCNAAAIDIPRQIVKELQDSETTGVLRIIAVDDRSTNSYSRHLENFEVKAL